MVWALGDSFFFLLLFGHDYSIDFNIGVRAKNLLLFPATRVKLVIMSNKTNNKN